MPPRLSGWDYGAPGSYFITVCTHSRRLLFGLVDGERVVLSPLGRLAQECLSHTFERTPDARLEASVVMPDHVHLLVQRDSSDSTSPPIDQLVRDFKAKLTHEARAMELLDPREPVWQRGYFDRVVRTQQEHAALVAYVETNPVRWTLKRRGAST